MQLSPRNKTGLVLAFLLGLLDCTSLLTPSGTEGSQDGPPTSILVLDTVLGVITVVAVVIAWRTLDRRAIRAAAAARILSAVSALPAFFVDVPAGIKILVSAFVVLTFASVVLMLSPARQREASR